MTLKTYTKTVNSDGKKEYIDISAALSDSHAPGSDAETASTVAAINHGTTEKINLVDADEITGQDSQNTFSLIRSTWINVKIFLKAYFDGIGAVYVICW